MKQNTFTAHGGKLLDLIVSHERRQELEHEARDMPAITLSRAALADLELLINGGFSPLCGFMNQSNYEQVLTNMRLCNGTLWPMPVCLEVADTELKGLQLGSPTALRDKEGFMPAALHIDDIWRAEHQKSFHYIIFLFSSHNLGHLM